jgi:hypothetical protein
LVLVIISVKVLRSRSLAFVGNHDAALAYALRALALNQEGWRFEVRVQ